MLLSTLRQQDSVFSHFKVFASLELPVFFNSTFKTNELTVLYIKCLNKITPLLVCVLYASCNSQSAYGGVLAQA